MNLRNTRITLQVGSKTYSVDKPDFEPQETFDDFVNLMFISGTDIDQILQILNSYRENTPKNHKINARKADKGPCNL